MSRNFCNFCQGPTPEAHNYCSWECHIAEARKNGGKEIRPNGLPIACIRHDFAMMEHEHADHPDYKFPVEVEYIGPKAPPDDEMAQFDEASQTHALIYTDGSVALMLFECSYAMAVLSRDGVIMGGALWPAGEWRLTTKAIEAIRKAWEDWKA